MPALACNAARCYIRPMSERQRVDRVLVERGLCESRAKAQAAIAAGLVTADGIVVRKASDVVAANAVLHADPAHPFVSRGGLKLAAALDHFRFDPARRICIDVGASTGGFTDVLVTRGARRVYAVDVGTGQLHTSLRGRPEIVALEQTNIRNLDHTRLAEQPDFVAVDVSFISLRLVLPPALALTAPRSQLVALIKPQFEAGKAHLKKGIVRDPALRADVCDGISEFIASLGWTVAGVIPSPIAGGDGNHEFLVGAARG
jgi:23S rRNA (cytidine1920-2'-O)/16S rRNA (cytidine1409-2'-O)-methyltransferase